MKHLKLYEKKFNKNSLKKFAEEKDELYRLIKEYSILNNIFEFETNDEVIDFYYEHNYQKVGDEVIIVSIENTKVFDDEDKVYSITNLDDLNKYIEDPEIYTSTKKYNL